MGAFIQTNLQMQEDVPKGGTVKLHHGQVQLLTGDFQEIQGGGKVQGISLTFYLLQS